MTGPRLRDRATGAPLRRGLAVVAAAALAATGAPRRRGLAVVAAAALAPIAARPALGAPLELRPRAAARPAPVRLDPCPPDPRRGERLDGRRPPGDPRQAALAVPRALLRAPRAAVRGLAWPAVAASGLVERRRLVPRVYWALTSDDERVAVRPDVRIESGFLPQIGARVYDRRSLGRGSEVGLRLRGWSARSVSGAASVRGPARWPVALGLEVAYDRREDLLFAGTRGESNEELAASGVSPARYERDLRAAHLTLARAVREVAVLRLRGALEDRVYGDGAARGGDPAIGEIWDVRAIPGFTGGARLLRGGLGLQLGDADAPRSGDRLRLTTDVELVEGFDGDPSRHVRAAAEARLALDLDDRLLILRARGSLVEQVRGAPVPFEDLVSIAGADGVRGLPSGRLRGHSGAVASAEYRWFLSPFLDASVFADAGGAFGRWFTDSSLADLEPSVGVGLRAYGERNAYWLAPTLVSIGVAWSPDEGPRALLVVSSD